jgi:hypothetical protein
MSLITRRRAIFARVEDVSGQDNLAALTDDQRKAFALPVFDAGFMEIDREKTDRDLYQSSLSPQIAQVGAGSARIQFNLDFRGSGSATRDPDWVSVLKACGMQRFDGTKLAAESLRYFTSIPTTASGGRYIRGESVYGSQTLLGAAWDTAAGNGDGLGTTPSVGDTFLAFADASSEDRPIASGTIIALSGTTILLRCLDGARIPAQYFIKANTTASYQKVTTAQPVLMVCDLTYDEGAFTSDLWGWVAQGTFANSMHIIGGVNGVQATLAAASAVTTSGVGMRPLSEQTVQVTAGAWSGATPAAGAELIKQNAPGKWLAAAKVVAVNGSVFTLQVYYGSFALGDTVYDANTFSAATLSAGQSAADGPSVTVWDYVDGFLKRGVGMRGSWTIELTAGEQGRIVVDLSGVPAGVASAPQPSGIFFGATTAPRWESGVADFLGIPLRTRSAQMGYSTEQVRVPDANAADGTVEYLIASRTPELTFVVDRPGNKGWQFEEADRLASWRPAGFRCGASANNSVSVVVPRMQIRELRDANESGLLALRVTARAIGVGGDDEVFLFAR